MKREKVRLRKNRPERTAESRQPDLGDAPSLEARPRIDAAHARAKPVGDEELARRREVFERVMKLRAEMEPLGIPVDELIRRERGQEP